MASLTVPEGDLWVNLSPYEQNRVIPDALGQTEMGRDMLSQDYYLKQLASTLMLPNYKEGERFWHKIHKKLSEEFGVALSGKYNFINRRELGEIIFKDRAKLESFT